MRPAKRWCASRSRRAASASARHRGAAPGAAPPVHSDRGASRAPMPTRPVPIGEGQTISQPYIVALMTELVRPQPGDRVLEVGTGSGYQAAVLARLVKPRLHDRARSNAEPPGRDAAARAEIRKHHRAYRRRLRRMAGARAVRHRHRDRSARARPAAVDRPAQAGRPADRAGRPALHACNSCS